MDELIKKRNKEDRSNREIQGRTEENKEKREERIMCMDRWKDECQKRIVGRVEKVVTKYIRNIFVEVEQWVEDKMVESDRIREEENRKKDGIIMGRMDKLEKKIDRRMKGMEKAIDLIKREVREIREMIIGVRDE